jgi:hypothetical protein
MAVAQLPPPMTANFGWFVIVLFLAPMEMEILFIAVKFFPPDFKSR